MSRTSFSLSVAGALVAATLVAPAPRAQTIHRPQPTFVQNVRVDRSAESEQRVSLLLRNGRIEAVLAADADVPPGTRVVDGEGLLCLPAFLDAYTTTGVETPEPVKDQDVPVDTGADIRIDMRLANRKGIQPAFRAVEALAIEAGDSEAWREAGFGAALVSPAGELLAGTSCVATTREAAMRDLVVRADAFAHAAFQATGPGYPSTLMGFIAQLRQFFHDAGRNRVLEARYADGRPGLRPPFDPELAAGGEILSKEQRVLCEAETHRDVERWIKLADEFDFEIAIAGGKHAWRVADVLAERDVPVVLTLDWGKEVDDPRPDDDAEEEAGEESDESEGDEAAPEEVDSDSDVQVQEAAAGDEESGDEEAGEATDDEPNWDYTEPLGVRLQRRVEWEEGRDSTLVLADAGVRLAFGTAKHKPKKLLEHVRTLIENGLSEEAALAALTTTAAEILGVDGRLGRIQPGYDATLALWSADPLTDEDAQPVWVFVDGFPTEYDKPEPKEERSGEGPADGIDVTGTWTLEVESEEGANEVTLTLEMSEDGTVEGEHQSENPMDDSELITDVTGYVSGNELVLDATLEFASFSMDLGYELTIEDEALSGAVTYTAEFFAEPMERAVEGARTPERSQRVRDAR